MTAKERTFGSKPPGFLGRIALPLLWPLTLRGWSRFSPGLGSWPKRGRGLLATLRDWGLRKVHSRKRAGVSNSPGSCILFTVVKCDRGGRARPSPALVRKETAKSFRVVAPAFPEGRESPNSCLGLHKRRARIRKNGPTTEEGGSPSSECYYYEAGLRGSGRLQGAAGGVRGSYRRALRRS